MYVIDFLITGVVTLSGLGLGAAVTWGGMLCLDKGLRR